MQISGHAGLIKSLNLSTKLIYKSIDLFSFIVFQNDLFYPEIKTKINYSKIKRKKALSHFLDLYQFFEKITHIIQDLVYYYSYIPFEPNGGS